jgi:hypothetical protein
MISIELTQGWLFHEKLSFLHFWGTYCSLMSILVLIPFEKKFES